MEQLIQLLTIVGLIEAAVLVVGIIYAIYLWITGITPVLYRLGNGLAKRKIAIYARGDNLITLKNLLLESKLFKEKNICDIPQLRDIESSEDAGVYLVYWPDWENDIDAILARKPESCALVVYQPYDQGRISEEQMRKLDGKRHTAVTNFRGRLLNDIVTSMITTSYEKK
ncbi:MAG: hypothetical protein Q8P17_05245 [bacterium]|nr:hypothetical protein [bacterium]